ncbi:beta-1,3-galactosyltransferase 5-like [Pristis pectinata]|uniref:beta-1,3-galactosyltransferase 5-like n=1 Tax=Pristis pectinata TaxID=685728 RepID=UPI00223E68FF|nr:beta-1,3-galactosyltransferase 5-like [Pristis pectinata]
MKLRTYFKVLVLVLLPMSAFLILAFQDPGRLTEKAGRWVKSSLLEQVGDRERDPTGSGGVDFAPLFSQIYEPPPCQQYQDLMVLVTSAPPNIDRRNAIRSTWARRWRRSPFSWQVVFLVGRATEQGVDAKIREEQDNFQDLLVGNYLDTYRNLTLKVMHGLKWVTSTCRPAYVLKTDDDCFVNTDRLPGFLIRDNQIRTRLYAGSLFPAERREVIRDPGSKWYVSRQDYDKDRYPPYVSGVGYVLSLDAARAILEAAASVRPIPVEDAYVGILAEEADIPPLGSGRFTKHNVNWRVCNYRYLMVIHHLSTQEQQLAHSKMVQAWTACSESVDITKWD